jgi:hypothetical protein
MVSSVNSDLSANPRIAFSAPGYHSGRDILPVAADVLTARVVKEHEPGPASVVILIDNHVEPGWRALVSLVEFTPQLATQNYGVAVD